MPPNPRRPQPACTPTRVRDHSRLTSAAAAASRWRSGATLTTHCCLFTLRTLHYCALLRYCAHTLHYCTTTHTALLHCAHCTTAHYCAHTLRTLHYCTHTAHTLHYCTHTAHTLRTHCTLRHTHTLHTLRTLHTHCAHTRASPRVSRTSHVAHTAHTATLRYCTTAVGTVHMRI